MSSKTQPSRVNAFSVDSASIALDRLADRRGCAAPHGLDGRAQIGDAGCWPGFTSSTVRPERTDVSSNCVAGRLDVRVALLDEQPVLLALLDLHERPLAVELVAAQLEEELALLESFAPILERDPLAAVPHDHAARAVVALGDDPLEVAVLERVILDLHGEALVVHVVRRALGHRPRPEDAVHLQAQVEMQTAGGVLVHDEQPAGDDGRPCPPARACVSGDRLARYALRLSVPAPVVVAAFAVTRSLSVRR